MIEQVNFKFSKFKTPQLKKMPIAFRTVRDFVLFCEDPARIINLWFKTGIIKNEHPHCCGKPGLNINNVSVSVKRSIANINTPFNKGCNGTLHATKRNHQRYKKHGGWHYKCRGGNCGGRMKSILYGTIWQDLNIPLRDVMMIIWHYVHINSKVTYNLYLHFTNL